MAYLGGQGDKNLPPTHHSRPHGPRVSAALRSRDAGESRASLGDPGCCLGGGTPCGVLEKRNHYMSISLFW